jgi:hypothetical protein
MTVSVNGTTGITFNDASTQNTAATGFGFKNRIINGAMMIDQRNAGASVTVNSAAYTYTLDRWAGFGKSSAGVFTVARSSVAPNNFTNSALITVTTASTPSGADLYGFRQAIEGFNFADIGWGTSSAQPITISFWVRSSLTGTFGASVFSNQTTDTYPFTYTISAANTWEQKTVTIQGRTSGSWNTTNGNGINLWFCIGGGTTATANTWNTTGDVLTPAGATNIIATNGATWQVTGVQLEKGSTATSFDYRPYGTELALCQRYYGRFQSTGIVTSASFGTGIANSTSQGAITIQFPQTMRSSPTISQSQTAITDSSTYDSNVSAIAAQYTCTTNARLVLNTAGGMTQYRTGLLIAQSSTSGYVDFSAEL